MKNKKKYYIAKKTNKTFIKKNHYKNKFISQILQKN